MLSSVMVGVHDWFSWVVVSTNAIAGLWALMAHRRQSWRGQPLWVFTVIAQVSMLAQVALGSWLVAQEGHATPDLHALYGFSGLVTVGIVYSYRQQIPKHKHLLYGYAGLFLMGLGIRAMILD